METERVETMLGDGTPVVLRRLGPADREWVAEGYRRLSPEARYQRFWTRSGEVIGERMLDRLLSGDPARHQVWSVLDEARDFPGVGAASFWRDREDSELAEFSCTVLDADQRRGAGTLLLAALWVAALKTGARRFEGFTMPENRRAVRWMGDCGAESEWDGYKVIFRWDLEDVGAIPATRVGRELAERLAELAG